MSWRLVLRRPSRSRKELELHGLRSPSPLHGRALHTPVTKSRTGVGENYFLFVIHKHTGAG